MPKRSKSSERWLQRQRKDYFVRKAQDGGQVSRAHYKLAQIDERFHILSARKRVLELGMKKMPLLNIGKYSTNIRHTLVCYNEPSTHTGMESI